MTLSIIVVVLIIPLIHVYCQQLSWTRSTNMTERRTKMIGGHFLRKFYLIGGPVINRNTMVFDLDTETFSIIQQFPIDGATREAQVK